MKKKHTIALCLLAFLLLTGCGAATEEDTQTTATETIAETEPETSILDELGEQDFGGKDFLLLDYNYNPDLCINIPGDELTGDLVGDALYERDIFIEDTYNFELQYEQQNPPDKVLENSVLAGDDTYQIMISNATHSLAVDGYLANLCRVEHLTLDAPWWSKLMYENMRIDDVMFITTGDISPSVYQTPSCMFLNTALLEDLGIDTDVFNLVLEGKWTLDEVYALTADVDRDENGDGELSLYDDFFGIVTGPGTAVPQMFLECADTPFCKYADGKITLALDEAAEGTIEKLRTIIQYILPENKQNNDFINVTFKEGRALLIPHKTQIADTDLRDMEDPYVVLPMPKKDLLQENYISLVSSAVCAFFEIPKTTDLEYAGFVAEAMARYSYEHIRPLAYDTIYITKTPRDIRTVDMIEIIFDTLYLDFNSCFNFGGVRDVVSDMVFHDKPFASSLASIQKKVEKAAAAFMENWVKNG